MASSSSSNNNNNNSFLLLTFVFAAVIFISTNAGNPDILTDHSVPPSLNPDAMTRQYFTYTGPRQLDQVNITGRAAALITKVTAKQLTALQGQSVSTAVLMFSPGSINPQHNHPRGLLVLQGELEVGLVDTNNKLLTQMLKAPNLFIFPKGLVHFQISIGKDDTITVDMYGSASAGTVKIGKPLFGCGIGVDLLSKGFKTDEVGLSMDTRKIRNPSASTSEKADIIRYPKKRMRMRI